MTAITQPGCRECAAPRGLHRFAISLGLVLVQWGRKRAELRAARPMYEEQLRRVHGARDGLVWRGQSGHS
ncbi:MAG: hypothetical protein ABI255_05780 [Microbacteriaceae bacterium]